MSRTTTHIGRAALFTFLLVGVCVGEYNDAPATHHANIAFKPVATNAVMADFGLATNTAYVCFAISDSSYLTYAEATNSWREIVYSLTRDWYDIYTALATTNKPAKVSFSQTTTASGTTLSLIHQIVSRHAISGGVADE